MIFIWIILQLFICVTEALVRSMSRRHHRLLLILLICIERAYLLEALHYELICARYNLTLPARYGVLNLNIGH